MGSEESSNLPTNNFLGLAEGELGGDRSKHILLLSGLGESG